MGKNEQVDGATTTCHFEHDKLDNEEKKGKVYKSFHIKINKTIC